jgi:hypothetical protein
VFYPWKLRDIPVSSWTHHLADGTRLVNYYNRYAYDSDIYEVDQDSSNSLCIRETSKIGYIEFEATAMTNCEGRVDFYARREDIPAMRERLQNQKRLISILVKEHTTLTEESKDITKELENRRKNLGLISRARTQILLTFDDAQREKVNQCDKLVELLWKPQAAIPTGVCQVDDFLTALKEYRRLEANNPRPRPIQLGDVSKLASVLQAWLRLNENVPALRSN